MSQVTSCLRPVVSFKVADELVAGPEQSPLVVALGARHIAAPFIHFQSMAESQQICIIAGDGLLAGTPVLFADVLT